MPKNTELSEVLNQIINRATAEMSGAIRSHLTAQVQGLAAGGDSGGASAAPQKRKYRARKNKQTSDHAAPKKKKRKLTAAGRKRLSDLMTARWAAKRKAAKK